MVNFVLIAGLDRKTRPVPYQVNTPYLSRITLGIFRPVECAVSIRTMRKAPKKIAARGEFLTNASNTNIWIF